MQLAMLYDMNRSIESTVSASPILAWVLLVPATLISAIFLPWLLRVLETWAMMGYFDFDSNGNAVSPIAQFSLVAMQGFVAGFFTVYTAVTFAPEHKRTVAMVAAGLGLLAVGFCFSFVVSDVVANVWPLANGLAIVVGIV
jgi:fumarate reductase subunit D